MLANLNKASIQLSHSRPILSRISVAAAMSYRTFAHRFGAAAYDRLFRHLHQNRLIFNACWEDPRLDRSLLGLDGNSRVVMITSAGCNALDYLLDGPAEIHAVDLNPKQNAVLSLKKALFQRGCYRDLFKTFGEGQHPGFAQILNSVRELLVPYARSFWAQHAHYLDGSSLRRSFYYHGTCGDMAWMFRICYLRMRQPVRESIRQLLEATSLVQQREIYSLLEPALWNRISCWLIRQPMILSMLGVPRAQSDIIAGSQNEGIAGYVRERLRRVATEIPIQDNYFWRVYITGSYTRACCPNYLKEEHFDTLRPRQEAIHLHHSSLTQFLRTHPKAYTHYVLLDHQDWLAWHNPKALEEEWQLILENSRSGTRILFRSAGLNADFLPSFAAASVRFHPERTAPMHLQDRVGTYGSVHLAEVL